MASRDKDELRREKHRRYMRGYYSRNKVRLHELSRKKRLAEKMPKKCPICGETKVFASRRTKYCSSECSKKALNLAVKSYHKRWESKGFSTLVPKRPILLDLLQKFEQERQIKAVFSLTSLDGEVSDSFNMLYAHFLAGIVNITALWRAIEEGKDDDELKGVYLECKTYLSYFDSYAFSVVSKFKGRIKDAMHAASRKFSATLSDFLGRIPEKYAGFYQTSRIFEGKEPVAVSLDSLLWAKEKELLKDSDIALIKTFFCTE